MQTALANAFSADSSPTDVLAGDRVGVGVSGGADSVALLRLLDGSARRAGVRLAFLHFNHQLRGAESDADEQFVAALAAERGIDFLCGARRCRRRSAGARLEPRRCGAAVALRVFRLGGRGRPRHARCRGAYRRRPGRNRAGPARAGTGPAGLAAIYPVKVHVVRPLLEFGAANCATIRVPKRAAVARGRLERGHDAAARAAAPQVSAALRAGSSAGHRRASWAAGANGARRRSLLGGAVGHRLDRVGSARRRPPWHPLRGPAGAASLWQASSTDGRGALAVTRRLVRGIIDELRGRLPGTYRRCTSSKCCILASTHASGQASGAAGDRRPSAVSTGCGFPLRQRREEAQAKHCAARVTVASPAEN